MLRLRDLAGPIECASGTYQADVCVDRLWCGVHTTFEVAVEAPSCPATPPSGALDAGAGVQPPPPTRGCAVGAGAGPGLMVGLLALAWRRRRGSQAR